MKIIITLLLLIPVSLFSQQNGIVFFEGSWGELLQKAQTENKPVFVDCYTDWCGPCKWMAKNVFPNDTAGAFYNEHFVNYQLDMEKGEGPEIAKQYGVEYYPTYLFLDAQGSMLHRAGGRTAMEKFVAFGETALNPEARLSGMQKKFEAGNRTSEFIYTYVEALTNGGDDKTAEKTADAYFESVPEDSLLSAANWKIIRDFRKDMKSREYAFVLNNKAQFKEAFGDEAGKYLVTTAQNAIYPAAKANDTTGFEKIISVLRENAAEPEVAVSRAWLGYFYTTGQWDKYAHETVKNIEKGYYKTGVKEMEQSGTLNNFAWNFYEHIDDKELLGKAEEWVKLSVQLDENYYNLDTYAAVLFKLGKKKEGKQMAKKAIAKAKTEGADYKSTKELLEKYK